MLIAGAAAFRSCRTSVRLQPVDGHAAVQETNCCGLADRGRDGQRRHEPKLWVLAVQKRLGGRALHQFQQSKLTVIRESRETCTYEGK